MPPAELSDGACIAQRALALGGIGSYRYTLDGIVTAIDGRALAIFDGDTQRLSETDALGAKIDELIEYVRPQGHLRRRLREDGPQVGLEYPFRTIDGATRWVIHDTRLIIESGTREIIVDALIRDITRTETVGTRGRPASRLGLDSLTSRERDVVEELVRGNRPKAIAKVLNISPATVRNHLKSVYRKLEVRSQVELLGRYYGISHG